MGEFLDMVARTNAAYLKGQLVLFVPVLCYVLLRGSRLKLVHRAVYHNILVASSMLLPFVILALPSIPAPASDSVVMPALLVAGAVDNVISSPRLSYVHILLVSVGLCGLLYLGLHLAWQMRAERRVRKGGHTVKYGRVSLVFSDRVGAPFSSGLFRPAIYMPSSMRRNPRVRALALRHEAQHIRRGHVFMSLVETVHARLCWYNPVAFLLERDGRLTREHTCDNVVTRQYPSIEYCRLLVDQAEQLLTSGGLVLASPLGKHALEKRIRYLTEGTIMKKTTIGATVLLVLSLVAAGTVLFWIGCSVAPAAGDITGTDSKPEVTEPTVQSDAPPPKFAKAGIREGEEPTPDFAKAGIKEGGRPKANVMRGVMANLSELRYAYNKRLRERAGLAGKIVMKYAMDASGSVIAAEVIWSTMDDEQLERTVVEKIKTWEFGPIEDKDNITEVIYPFVFSQ